MQPGIRSTPAALILILALGWLLAAAVPDAGAARYAVAQCGWKVGNDGNWIETANEKFNRSSWCGVPPGSDPWDGVHVTSGTRGSSSAVGGTKFARWRWNAPPGTGIVTVNGARWHVLKDNFQHRLGSAPAGGSFRPFAEFSSTDKTRRDFNRAFSPPAAAFESRLLCARPSDRLCSLTGTSLAGVRGMTLTLEDPARPVASLSGTFRSGAWLRGVQGFSWSGTDVGSGLRYAETVIDGSARASTEHPCEIDRIAGQWRGRRMQPCRTAAAGSHSIDTGRLSDGPHAVAGCAIDFAGSRGCSAPATLRVDNNAPAAPRGLAVVGGDAWRKTNSFDLKWTNPDQGIAAPIAGVRYRITGPGSYDSGLRSAGGIEGLAGLKLPGAGSYRVSVWLVDAAGNENPAAVAVATLRLDDVDPVAFLLDPAEEDPELLGPQSATSTPGRPLESSPTGARVASSGGTCRPGSRPPERAPRSAPLSLPTILPPGRYDIRARVRDAAGNEAVSDRRERRKPPGTQGAAQGRDPARREAARRRAAVAARSRFRSARRRS